MDPNSALAYSGLADAWKMVVYFGISDPDEEARAFENAKTAVKKVLELDSQSAEAYASLGGILQSEYCNISKAEEASAVLQKSIELNPGYAPAHLWYSLVLASQGRQEEWKKELFKAYELSPLSPSVLDYMGQYYWHIGDIDKAIETLKQAIKIEPSYPGHMLSSHISMEAENNMIWPLK